MAVNAKKKGSSFEREIANDLSEFFGMEKAFSRSSGSGNKFGGKNAKNLNRHNRQASKAMLGDIQTPDAVDLIVECKSYASLPFNLVIAGKAKQVQTWLDQLLDDQRTFYKVFKENLPIVLFIKINRAGVYAVFRREDVRSLYKRLKIPHVNFNYRGKCFVMVLWDNVKDKVEVRNRLYKRFVKKGQ